MTTGSNKEVRDRLPRDDADSHGQVQGVPSAGSVEGNSYHPLGESGVRHWQASQTSRPGYEEEQVLGRNCRFLQGEQADPHTLEEVRNALRERRSFPPRSSVVRSLTGTTVFAMLIE
ncbi:hypothetical protein [Massilia sp. BSC265]|uniref:hypothetical protein n=1 Tax=Massilia sp. BSC265 TaxID=1549812 RepID=UPI0004E8753C|nr:hypothetical protein [Massilia sp. BSC265]KFI07529.1 hypothetical protein JN27_07965 [Massilia sp. BSC265]